ncbi:membrane protein [Halolactibacillus alkaliphilus]|uniref:Membrane protein n=1 Tax=Halolactibacillus alkaliphilus TaxID=442899 RepID=A0A511X0Y4_9BACI|nr:ABC-2 transporter permease [Halolactibacillus alkaliphilus]GEN56609.1 membrane protein [Halolactibacillus alkaliphilus]GGN69768.1 membrane protein [Halolactibacillus alkaliphilus]SFO76167.1 ABC-2 family transporter protein [Halolactibacillus alkaliphilus]
MKGLLLKDIFTLEKQMRVLLIVIVGFALTPASNMIGFTMIYALIIPISSFGYDERAKWDQLLRMMPIHGKTIVLSKYVLGYGFFGLISVIILIAQFVYHAFGYQNLSLVSYPVFLVNVIVMVLTALIAYAVLMPFIFKLGMEKGRLVFGAVFAIILFLTFPMSFFQIVSDGIFVSSWFIWILLLLAIVVNIGSIKLSQRFYSQNTHS